MLLATAWSLKTGKRQAPEDAIDQTHRCDFDDERALGFGGRWGLSGDDGTMFEPRLGRSLG